ncbi:hypothetical protein GUJ93_ZPchr0007g6091 [Zizania palustris]|uniref:Myb/SANT-like domain-containing protein n=1 Tax=Zizania palustris TaxID=103762 RepID=A0A8J5SSI1_ZIZPA|nr:hypothetical protein GUJ93_ZPchr0007g6091 [Zizania palustris]
MSEPNDSLLSRRSPALLPPEEIRQWREREKMVVETLNGQQINRTTDQIANHLKTLKKKYSRINYLKNLSAAGWDEVDFIVTFDHEHYTNHFEDGKNKGDDEFINKPLPYYGILATIFGNSVATGQFVRTSQEQFYVDMCDNSHKDGMTPNESGTSSDNKPSKRAKKDDSVVDDLVGAIDRGTETLASLAEVIKEVAAAKTTPEGLFEEVDNLPGFELEHKSKYFAYLVANPDIARAFMKLPLLYKITWISTFLNQN